MKKIFRPISFVLLIAFTSLSLRVDVWAEVIQDSKGQNTKEKITPARQFQSILIDTEKLLEEIEEGKEITTNLNQIKENKITLNNLANQLREEFNQTRADLISKNLPDEIIKRHDEFVEKFEEKLTILLNNLDEIEKTKGEKTEKIKKTKEFLKNNLPKPKHIPVDPNKLPHRRQELKPREPITSVKEFKKKYPELATTSSQKPILLASLSNSIPTTTDPNLSETVEVQFTQEIKDLAASLEYNPVKIYQYVKNNFDYEVYYGSLKGSQETLLEKSGNDADLASLLIALLRASDIPARYVYGTIRVPSDKAMAWLGVKDIYTAGTILSTAGIPVKFITSGGSISGIELEHIWVEAYINYFPYQGLKKGTDNTWIPIDPSFQQYIPFDSSLPEYSGGLPVIDLNVSDTVKFDIDSYLSGVKEPTATITYLGQVIDYLHTHIPEGTLPNFLPTLAKKIEVLKVLPASLPYKSVILARYSELPDNLRHKITFQIPGVEGSDLEITLNTVELAGKRVTLSYGKKGSEDTAVVAGGENTQAYTILLKPVLKLEGQIIATGTEELTIGSSHTFNILFYYPGMGVVDIVSNEMQVGSFYSIGFKYQTISGEFLNQRAKKLVDAIELLGPNPDIKTLCQDSYLGEYLYFTALNYLSQLQATGGIIDGLMHTKTTRQITEAITGTNQSITYLFELPYQTETTGVYIDVDRDIQNPFSITGDQTKSKEYSILSGYTSSGLEHLIYEKQSGINSISAVKAIQIAKEQGLTVYDIDKTNINQIVPILGVSEQVKQDIVNSVNVGKVVKIPEQEITYYDWRGVGYIVMDPETGAAGYLISGGLSGGGSVVAMNLSTLVDTIIETITSYYKNKIALIVTGAVFLPSLVEKHPVIFFLPEVFSLYDEACAFQSLFISGYYPYWLINPKDDEVLKILEKSPKIFFFSGHGFSDKLALTGEAYEKEKKEGIIIDEGMLEVEEINVFNYNFKLVAMNSCSSGDRIPDKISLWEAFDIPEDSQTGCYLGWTGDKPLLDGTLFYIEFWCWNAHFPLISIKTAINLSFYKRNLKIYGNPELKIR